MGPGVLNSILKSWRSDWTLGFLGERELHGGFLKDDSWVWARLDGDFPEVEEPCGIWSKGIDEQ